jgi:hypothetical protein
VLLPLIESTQYLAIRYTERLADAGAVTSVGSKGDSYDNALAESFNGLYKTELIRRRGPWNGLDDVEFATLEYVDWSRYAGDPSVVRTARPGWLTWPSRRVLFVPRVMAVA